MATIDLSQLPAPDVVEVLDYEILLAERKATLLSLFPEDQQAVMLAYATGADLDNIAAMFSVERLTITPADTVSMPAVAAVMESDADFRIRAQQAFEGLSVAGPVGAYEYHGRSADGGSGGTQL